MADFTDEQLARFATPRWVDGVASVPLDEMAIMVAEDPSVMTALIGAVRHERKRTEELRALVARLSQSEPLPDEVQHALDRQGALLAEVGTLRARTAELERERDSLGKVVDVAIAWRDSWRYRRPSGDEDKAVALVDAVDVFLGIAKERT